MTASEDGTARIWEVASGLPLGEPFDCGAKVLSATFSPDGTRVVTTDAKAVARIWEVPPSPREPVPDWILSWTGALIGLRVEANGSLIEVPWEQRKRLEAKARRRELGGWILQPSCQMVL